MIRDYSGRIGLPTRRKVTEERDKKTIRKMDGFLLSDEGDCASSRECFISVGKKSSKQAWCDERELYLSDNGRVYVGAGITFIDAVTGTMFRDGRCLSSDYVTMGNVVRDQAGATAILMAVETGMGHG